MDYFNVAVIFPSWASNALLPGLRTIVGQAVDNADDEHPTASAHNPCPAETAHLYSVYGSGELSSTEALKLTVRASAFIDMVLGPCDHMYAVACAVAYDDDWPVELHVNWNGGGEEAEAAAIDIAAALRRRRGSELPRKRLAELYALPPKAVDLGMFDGAELSKLPPDELVMVAGAVDTYNDLPGDHRRYWNNIVGWVTRRSGFIFKAAYLAPPPVETVGFERVLPAHLEDRVRQAIEEDAARAFGRASDTEPTKITEN